MANMSYCRFENTTGDFRDCLEALREEEEAVVDGSSHRMSAHERRFADRLVELCNDYIEVHKALVAAEEEDDEDAPSGHPSPVQPSRV